MYKGGNPLMRLYKTMLNASIKKRCEGNPKLFGSAEDYDAYFGGIGTVPEKDTIEIMVHPVYDRDGNLCDACAGTLQKLERPQK